MRNFTVGMTDIEPRIGNDPLNSAFVKFGSHGALGDGGRIALNTTQDVQGRYLFVAATVDGYFHLREVEVFQG